jgi:plasmid maintenance system antidote protein VapI
MTDLIRDAVSDHIKTHGMTRTEAAAAAGLPRQYVTDLLKGRKGTLPKNWARLLDSLGLELVVRPKRRGSR